MTSPVTCCLPAVEVVLEVFIVRNTLRRGVVLSIIAEVREGEGIPKS